MEISESIHCNNGIIKVDVVHDVMVGQSRLFFNVELGSHIAITADLIRATTPELLSNYVKQHVAKELRMMLEELERKPTWKTRFEDG